MRGSAAMLMAKQHSQQIHQKPTLTNKQLNALSFKDFFLYGLTGRLPASMTPTVATQAAQQPAAPAVAAPDKDPTTPAGSCATAIWEAFFGKATSQMSAASSASEPLLESK